MNMKVLQLKASGKQFYHGKKMFIRECWSPNGSWEKEYLQRGWDCEGQGRLVLDALRALTSKSSIVWKLGPGYLGLIWILWPDELLCSFLLECNMTVVFLNLTLSVLGAWSICSQKTCVGWEQLSLGHQACYGLSCPWGKNPGRYGLTGPWG